MLAEVVSNEKPYLTRPLLKPKKKPKASPASNPHFVENLYPTMPFFFFFFLIPFIEDQETILESLQNVGLNQQ